MRKIQKISIVGGTVGVLMAGGIAYAAWTSEGSGSATVKAGTEQGLDVTGGALVPGLFPTGNKDFTITVTNNNPYAVTIDDVVHGAISNDKSDSGCVSMDVTATESANDGTVLAASGTPGASHVFTFNLAMGANPDDGCQGATFTVPYTATAHSS